MEVFICVFYLPDGEEFCEVGEIVFGEAFAVGQQVLQEQHDEVVYFCVLVVLKVGAENVYLFANDEVLDRERIGFDEFVNDDNVLVALREYLFQERVSLELLNDEWEGYFWALCPEQVAYVWGVDDAYFFFYA